MFKQNPCWTETFFLFWVDHLAILVLSSHCIMANQHWVPHFFLAICCLLSPNAFQWSVASGLIGLLSACRPSDNAGIFSSLSSHKPSQTIQKHSQSISRNMGLHGSFARCLWWFFLHHFPRPLPPTFASGLSCLQRLCCLKKKKNGKKTPENPCSPWFSLLSVVFRSFPGCKPMGEPSILSWTWFFFRCSAWKGNPQSNLRTNVLYLAMLRK